MRAKPKRLFSNDWILTCDDGQEVLLDLLTWREGAEFSLLGETYSLEKMGAFSRDFQLRCGGSVVAVARNRRGFRTHIDVEWAGRHLVLEKLSAFRRGFQLTEEERAVGTLRPQGFSRTTDIDLPEEFPLILRLFLLWLVVLMWNREGAAAAAS